MLTDQELQALGDVISEAIDRRLEPIEIRVDVLEEVLKRASGLFRAHIEALEAEGVANDYEN